jgi:hypothetical protein
LEVLLIIISSRKQYVSRFKKWNLRRYGVQESVTDVSPSELSTALGDSASPQRSHTEHDRHSCDDTMDIDPACPSATILPDAQSETRWPLNSFNIPEFPLPPSKINPSTRAWRGLLPSYNSPPKHNDVEVNEAHTRPNESSAFLPSYSSHAESLAAEITKAPALINETEPVLPSDSLSLEHNALELNEAPATPKESDPSLETGCLLCGGSVPEVGGRSHPDGILTDISESDHQWKLDQAHFYLAAKSHDDAWKIYDELLHQSQLCSNLTRLRIAVKLLQFAVTPDQRLMARSKLLTLRLSDDDRPVASPEPLWLMHLFLGIFKQAEADFPCAVQHVQRAVELCERASRVTHPGRDLRAHRALIAEVGAGLREEMRVLDARLLLTSPGLREYRAAVLPEDSMQMLLQWSLYQLEDGAYHVMLRSLADTVWFKAHDAISLEAIETTALFCFLWHKYEAAQEEPSPDALIWLVKDLETHLQMAAPMIFSTISSMKADVMTASFPAMQMNIGMGYIAGRAVVNFTNLLAENVNDDFLFSGHLANKFFTTYASSTQMIAPVEQQKQQYQLWVQKFVRHFALCKTPLAFGNAFLMLETPHHEAYDRITASLSRTEGTTGDEALDKDIPLPALSRSATPIAANRQNTVPSDHQVDERLDSSATVDMGDTPRSSITSSKASLRSLQRLGRVAQSLLKHNDNRTSQLPSEAMDRDSHSSWSLRRLTGVSYLSAASGVTVDGQPF